MRQQQLDEQQHQRELQRMAMEDQFKRDQLAQEYQFKQWEAQLKAQTTVQSSEVAVSGGKHGSDMKELMQSLIKAHSAPRTVVRDPKTGKVIGSQASVQ
jgi:hypothetical protein